MSNYTYLELSITSEYNQIKHVFPAASRYVIYKTLEVLSYILRSWFAYIFHTFLVEIDLRI